MDEASKTNQPIEIENSQTEVVEKIPEVVAKKKNNYFLIIILFLIISILGIATYLFFTDKLNICDEKSPDKEIESVIEDENEVEVDAEDEEVTEEYVMKNTGWGLFNLLEYGFSAEIPYFSMVQEVMDSEVTSHWNVRLQKNSFSPSTYLPNYVISLDIHFLPDDESIFGCGAGCAKEHYLDIDIFENKESKSLTEIKDIYFKSIRDNGEENNFIPNITEKENQKWSHKVISFTKDTPSDMGTIDGDLVVTEDFVYAITYFLSETPVDSYQIARKVIDSFEFSK